MQATMPPSPSGGGGIVRRWALQPWAMRPRAAPSGWHPRRFRTLLP
ncbi:hypothetical protein CZ771_08115 [Actinomycetales bacterium JB111]|nr:hypothetical protein CZ771_08115 [Actinomycetales bacterium JB111]